MAAAIGINTNTRYLDAGEEPNQVLLPISGYAKEPLLPLEVALQPISKLLDDLDMMVYTAKRNSKTPADGLTTNESAAIHLYTMQWKEPNLSLYTKLNSILRSERREPLKPWFRYMKLILTALYKLPSVKGVVWRGVRGDLSDQYNDDHIWWGFSSCTESMAVMKQFVGNSGVRTLFNIECINGKAIQAHSFFKKENEILLLPGTYMRVVSKWSPAKDLYIIQLRETPAPHPYLEPPFSSASTAVFTTTASPTTNKTTGARGRLMLKKRDSRPLKKHNPPISKEESSSILKENDPLILKENDPPILKEKDTPILKEKDPPILKENYPPITCAASNKQLRKHFFVHFYDLY
ncbi:unnamed protein product [Adineta steineri]|uniref:NAD(P)(+)--arginine ADP-ribosyltransferase n=1 Tax=Adineta steineri TaxID=433720 RepID=A0A818JKF1_9BILA|nr:unnamed protein product [Adineta steineri]CAF3543549.1 unnamed protein product [Adineta steineri]